MNSFRAVFCLASGAPDANHKRESLSCYANHQPQESESAGLRSFLTFMGFQTQLLPFAGGGPLNISRGLGDTLCHKFSEVAFAASGLSEGGLE